MNRAKRRSPWCDECHVRMRPDEVHLFGDETDGSRCRGIVYRCKADHWTFRCWGDGLAMQDAKDWAASLGGELVGEWGAAA